MHVFRGVGIGKRKYNTERESWKFRRVLLENIPGPDLLAMLYFSATEHFFGVGINYLCHYLKATSSSLQTVIQLVHPAGRLPHPVVVCECTHRNPSLRV